MKILVTGGRGQLGLSLQKISGEYPGHEFFFTDMPEADITDPAVMEGLVEKYGADVIVNCAAYTAVDKAESDPEAAERINAGGAAVLAGLAKKHGLKLVHISTDYVFDGTSDIPYKETDATGPVSVYGKTKLAGEKAVENAGIDAAIIRTSWLYSEFGNNFVKTMLRLAGTHNEINVVADQKGTPTYATDLARAIMALIAKGIEGVRLYHFSNDGETTWHGFAAEVFRLAGLEVRVNPITTAGYPTPAARPAYSVFDKTRIKQAGAEVPEWRKSLSDCMEIIKKNNTEL